MLFKDTFKVIILIKSHYTSTPLKLWQKMITWAKNILLKFSESLVEIICKIVAHIFLLSSLIELTHRLLGSTNYKVSSKRVWSLQGERKVTLTRKCIALCWADRFYARRDADTENYVRLNTVVECKQNKGLINDVTDSEIRKATSTLKKQKAPGIDDICRSTYYTAAR